MRSRPVTAVIVGFLLCLASSRASAAETAPVLEVNVVEGVVTASGVFDVPTSAALAWSVLSDYGHLAQFVSSLRQSVVRERTKKRLLVEQYAVGKLLFVSRQLRVLLEIQEVEPLRISFKDVGQYDFSRYEGFWALIESPEGTRVIYQLVARPRASLPAILATAAFRANATNLLMEVRAEMVRRAAQVPRPRGSCVDSHTKSERKSSCP